MKRIKNLTMMALTLAIIVVCLMASTLTASASNIPRCNGSVGCLCDGYADLDSDKICDRCGHGGPAHYSGSSHTHSWQVANPAQYRSDPTDPNKEQRKQV